MLLMCSVHFLFFLINIFNGVQTRRIYIHIYFNNRDH